MEYAGSKETSECFIGSNACNTKVFETIKLLLKILETSEFQTGNFPVLHGNARDQT